MNTIVWDQITGQLHNNMIGYVRRTKRGKPKPGSRAEAYHGSQNEVAKRVMEVLGKTRSFCTRMLKTPIIECPVRVGLVIFVPLSKGRGRNASWAWPTKFGDWDNRYKALLDALTYHRIIKDDNVSLVRGPCDVFGVPSGVYAAPKGQKYASFFWSIQRDTTDVELTKAWSKAVYNGHDLNWGEHGKEVEEAEVQADDETATQASCGRGDR